MSRGVPNIFTTSLVFSLSRTLWNNYSYFPSLFVMYCFFVCYIGVIVTMYGYLNTFVTVSLSVTLLLVLLFLLADEWQFRKREKRFQNRRK